MSWIEGSLHEILKEDPNSVVATVTGESRTRGKAERIETATCSPSCAGPASASPPDATGCTSTASARCLPRSARPSAGSTSPELLAALADEDDCYPKRLGIDKGPDGSVRRCWKPVATEAVVTVAAHPRSQGRVVMAVRSSEGVPSSTPSLKTSSSSGARAPGAAPRGRPRIDRPKRAHREARDPRTCRFPPRRRLEEFAAG
jgi:hypothetical protein